MTEQIVGDILRLTVLAGLGTAGLVAVLLWKKNLASRVTFLRFVIQAMALAAIFYVFSYSSVVPMLYVLLFIFGMSIILGRVYCGWLCPLGLILDLEIVLRKALKIRHNLIPDKLNIALHKGRYLIALIFLLIPIGFWIATPDPLLASTLMLENLGDTSVFTTYSLTP